MARIMVRGCSSILSRFLLRLIVSRCWWLSLHSQERTRADSSGKKTQDLRVPEEDGARGNSGEELGMEINTYLTRKRVCRMMLGGMWEILSLEYEAKSGAE